MAKLKDFLPVPHPLKAILQDHGFPIAGAARYLDLSYNYISNILSGLRRATPEVEAKLKELVDQLEKENAKTAT